MRKNDGIESKSRGTKNNDGRTRRGFLQSIGITAGMLTGLSVGTREAIAASGSDAPESFRVQGKEIVTTQIRPDEIRVQRRQVSDDLKERYGQRAIVTTETYPRPEKQDDGLPKQDTETIRRPWDTYYAKEDEWTVYYEERDQDSSSVGSNARDKPADCPKWYYAKSDGGYERKGPMNLVGIATSGVDGIVYPLVFSKGWTDHVVQKNRHAWVPQNSQFEQQHKSAATDTYRLDGGFHAKFWKTGDYITGTAHEDSRIPHDAISFNTAEFKIVDIFNSLSYCNAIKNRYNFNNGGDLDHGGYVSHIYTNS